MGRPTNPIHKNNKLKSICTKNYDTFALGNDQKSSRRNETRKVKSIFSINNKISKLQKSFRLLNTIVAYYDCLLWRGTPEGSYAATVSDRSYVGAYHLLGVGYDQLTTDGIWKEQDYLAHKNTAASPRATLGP